jgi:6,7-dimethyl-8-ribityllumazine synthase
MSIESGGARHKRPAEPIADLVINDARIAIVASRFNDFIVERLVSGAMQVIQAHGVTVHADDVLYVPGAFELPLAARSIADKNAYDGVVALGTVIRGETAHFDYVCSECASGLMHVSLKYCLPIGFGVLTVDTEAQALARSGDADNKGVEATRAVLEMIALLRRNRV